MGTLGRLLDGGGAQRGGSGSGEGARGSAGIVPRGALAGLSEEELRAFGLKLLQQLPLLGSGPTLRLSALLHDAGKKVELVAEPERPRGRRVLRVQVEESQQRELHDVEALCHAVGTALMGTPSERLPVGLIWEATDHEEEDDEDEDMDTVTNEMSSSAESSTMTTGSSLGLKAVSDLAWEKAINWGEDEPKCQVEQELGSDVEMKDATEVAPTQPSPAPPTNQSAPKMKNGMPEKKKKPSLESDDEEDEEDMGITFHDDAADQAKANAASNITSTIVEAPINAGIHKNKNVWKQDNSEQARRVEASELALDLVKTTPMNMSLLHSDWMSKVCWDEDMLKDRVRIDASFGAPLVQSLSDTGCITKDEIMKAYGDDLRPGAVLRQEDLIAKSRKKEEPEVELGRKQLKKISKEERKEKLIENGYFRFIDKKRKEIEEMGRGISERLRCRRLPDIPRKLVVQDFKSWLPAKDARSLHRPKLNVSKPLEISAKSFSTVGGAIRQNRKTWNVADLSASHGPVCLLEYMQERPPLLQKVGMAGLLCNFYQVDKPTDEDYQPPKFNGPGRTVLLQPGDRSPFFAMLKPHQFYPAIANNLFVAPVAEHKVSTTDFLLVKTRRGGEEVSIRNIKSLHLVGQTEPSMEVFHPTDLEQRVTKTTNAMKSFLESFITYQIVRKYWRESKREGGNEDYDFVPPLTKDDINKALSTVALSGLVKSALDKITKKRKSVYELNDGEVENLDEYRDRVAGAGICQFESMQAGWRRLYDLGIIKTSSNDVNRVMHAHAVLMDLFYLKERAAWAMREAVKSSGTIGVATGSQEERDLAKVRHFLSKGAQEELRAAQYIVDELQLAPWYVTHSYITQRQAEKPRLKLTGLGEPSGRLEAVSYLPESIEGVTRKGGRGRQRRQTGQGTAATAAAILAAAAEDSKNEKKKKKKDQYGGTERDLRGIRLETGYKILKFFDHTDEEIELLDRWDRIMLIEEYASVYGESNIPFLSKFARNARKLTEKDKRERDATQKKVNVLFEKQVKALASEEPPAFSTVEDEKQLREERKKRKREQRKLAKEKALTGEEDEEEGAAEADNERDDEEDDDDDEDEDMEDVRAQNSDDEDEEDEDEEGDGKEKDKKTHAENEKSQLNSSTDDKLEETIRRIEIEEGSDSESDLSSEDDSDDDKKPKKKGLIFKKLDDDDSSDDDDDDEKDLSNFRNMFKQDKSSDSIVKTGSDGVKEGEAEDYQKLVSKMTSQQPTAEERKKLEDIIAEAKAKAEGRRIPPPPSWESSGRAHQIVRRTIIRKLPNGATEVEVQYTKSNEALKRVRERAQAFKSADPEQLMLRAGADGKPRPRGGPAGRAPPTEQELEEAKKRYKTYQGNIKRYGREWPTTVVGEPNQKRCGACGLPGHSSANSLCPLKYIEWTTSQKGPQKNFHKGKLINRNARASTILKNNKRQREKGDSDGRFLKKSKRNQPRKTGPLCDLNEIFNVLVARLYRMDESYHLRQKVDKSKYPHYYAMIRQPVWLAKIKNNVEKLKYASAEEFLADVELLHNNSVTFNGPQHVISTQAKAVVDTAKREIRKKEAYIKGLEEKIAAAELAPAPYKPRKKTKLFGDLPVTNTQTSSSTSSSSTNPALLVQSSSINLDAYAMTESVMPGTTPGDDFFGLPSGSPGLSSLPQSSPMPSSVMPGPSPSPLPASSPDPDLMDFDIDNTSVVEAVLEEEEEEEEL